MNQPANFLQHGPCLHLTPSHIPTRGSLGIIESLLESNLHRATSIDRVRLLYVILNDSCSIHLCELVGPCLLED